MRDFINSNKSDELLKQLGDLNSPKGNLIAFFYTLSLASGKQLDTNIGGEPMVFQSGDGQMLPALEEEVVKLGAGKSLSLTLPPERAFGPVLEEAMREFPLEAMPEEVRQVGRHVMVRDPKGEERMLEIVAIRGDKAVVDFNHDLAGQTLRFDIEVVTNEPCR